MTFTIKDHLKTGKYLGYSVPLAAGGVIQTALARVEMMGEVYVEEVQNILHELDQVQKDIDNARLGAGRSFQSGATGTAQFYRGERMNELKMSGRQHVSYLAQMTGLAVMSDVFASSAGGRGNSRVTRS